MPPYVHIAPEKEVNLIALKVILFRLERSDHLSTTSFTIQKVAEWNHNYFVTSLVSRGNNLVLGDAISSVSLLKVVDGQLKTVARDYGPLWPVCVEALDETNIIGANVRPSNL